MNPCVVVDCGNLTSPLQGDVSIVGSTFGSEANYSCLEGYELDGNPNRTCLESGRWSGSDPVCYRKLIINLVCLKRDYDYACFTSSASSCSC